MKTTECSQFKGLKWLLYGIVSLVSIFSVAKFFISDVLAGTADTVNIQGRIVRNDAGNQGLNVSAGSPACVFLGIANDTCDFKVLLYSADTGGTLLGSETFSNYEIGENNGVFNLPLGTGTYTPGSESSMKNVFLNNNSVYIEIQFAPDGATFTETFLDSNNKRMAARAVPYALNAQGAGSQFQFDVVNNATGYTGVAKGQVFFDGDDNVLRVYDGSDWLAIQASLGNLPSYWALNDTANPNIIYSYAGLDVALGGTTSAAPFFYDVSAELLTLTNTTTGASFRVNDSANDTTPFLIDGLGNVGVGTDTPLANFDVAGRTLKLSNFNKEYRWYWNNGSDTAWKNMVDITIGTGLYASVSFEVDVVDTINDYGGSVSIYTARHFVSAVRSGAAQDDTNNGTVRAGTSSYIRLVKTATGVYQLQGKSPSTTRPVLFTIRVLTIGNAVTLSFNDNPANGSTTGTNYGPSTTGPMDYAINTVNLGTLGVGGAVSSSKFQVNGTSDQIQSVIKAYSVQTTDLTQWQNSAATVVAGVNSAGGIFSNVSLSAPTMLVGVASSTGNLGISAATTSKSQINLVSSAGVNPSAPTSGDLWWNGTNLYFYDGSTNVDLLVGSALGPGGYFTDDGDVTYLTSLTDDFALGGTDSTAPLFFDEGSELLTLTNTTTGLSFRVNDQANDTTPFVIDADGNVGIGTTTPGAKLDIGGAASLISNTSGDITLDAASGTISFAGDSLNNVLNGTFSGDVLLNGGGQLQLGSFSSLPTAVGDGSIVYNSNDDNLYYSKAGVWQMIGNDYDVNVALPGTANQTLRHNGTGWVSSSVLTNDGTNLATTGQFKFGNFAVKPTATGEGSVVYDTVAKTLFVYDGTDWKSLGVNPIHSTTGVVSNGSYLELIHNENSNDLLITGWYYDSATSQWKQVSETSKTIKHQMNTEWDDAVASSKIHVQSRLNGVELAPSVNVGNGADGAITVASSASINTNNLITGRSCADGGDAVNYSVTALTPLTATLESSPSAGCLSVGDEVLIINLRGTATAVGNVGNYETLRVAGVAGSLVTFTTAKTKYYGDGLTDDTNIGVGTSAQAVMLQRVPNYTSVTVNASINFAPDVWVKPTGAVNNGAGEGGVMFFRANGAVTVNGTIHANGLGYKPGLAYVGNGNIYGGWAGEGFCGEGGGNANASNQAGSAGVCSGGGGGGSYAGSVYAGGAGSATRGGAGGGGGGGQWTANYGGGAGGGGYGSAGAGGVGGTGALGYTGYTGGINSSGNGGAGYQNGTAYGGGGGGGGTYGDANLNQLFMGSGGGGGGTSSGYGQSNGTGNGAGIIFISADSMTVSGGIQSIGNAGNVGCGGNAGGGGGGAGGSIKIMGNTLNLGASKVVATGGAGGATSPYAGGAGGNGRIAVYSPSAVTGATSPAATTSIQAYNSYGIYNSSVIATPNASSYEGIRWDQSNLTSNPTGDGETPYSTNGLVASWYLNETSGTTAASGGSCGATCNMTLAGFSNTTGQDVAAGSGWTSTYRRWGAGGLMVDGTDDRASVADNNNLDITGSIGIETWVMPHNISGALGEIFGKRDVSVAESNYDFRINADEIEFYYYANGGWQITTSSGADLVNNQWYHLAVTFDGTKVKLFKNGFEVASSCTNGTCNVPMVADNNSVSIGRAGDLASNYLDGVVDTVRLYNRVLTADEISKNAQNYLNTKISFQTRSGNTTDPTDGTWQAWRPLTSTTNYLSLNDANTHTNWSGTLTVLEGDVTRDIPYFEDEDESTATNITKLTASASGQYADATISSTNLNNYDYISAWVRSSQTGNTLSMGFGEAAGTEQTEYLTIDSANTWQKVYWDISDIATSNKDGVTKLRFTNLTSVATTIYIDNVKAEKLLITPSGSQIVSTPNNYLQYRAIFTTTNPSFSPTLESVYITYKDGFSIVQQDTNTVRLYNRSGSTQQLRLDAVTNAGSAVTGGAWSTVGGDVYRSTGKVGIGDSTPDVALKVVGAICAKANANDCAGNVAGTIYAVNTSLQSADLAEVYKVSDLSIGKGDVVSLVPDSIGEVTKATVGNSANLMGVISTNPGVLMNDVTGDNYRPVGLVGKLPIKVISSSISIKSGDAITASPISGFGALANKPGMIVARTLDDTLTWSDSSCPAVDSIDDIQWPEDKGNNELHPCFTVSVSSLPQNIRTQLLENNGISENDNIYVGKIMAYVKATWFEPSWMAQELEKMINDYKAGALGANSAWSLESGHLKSLNDVYANSFNGTYGNFNILSGGLLDVSNGKFKVDTSGNVSIDGDMILKGMLKSDSGSIQALLGDSVGQNKFEIFNSNGESIFSVDSTGEVSGKGVFRSEWKPIAAHGSIDVAHNLGKLPTTISLVKSMNADGSNLTSKGLGSDFYYESIDSNSIRIFNNTDSTIYVRVTMQK